jgi:anti-sigma factor RsiW
VIGHLGSRVSALLDGQLPAEEAERAWAHVHACHACRDLVEREGWVKTRLAGLTFDSGAAPESLKGSLLGSPLLPDGSAFPTFAPASAPGTSGARPRRQLGLVAIGGGAVGAAVMGVLALGVAPADVPSDRRPPTTSLVRQSEAPRVGTPVPTVQQRRVPTP